MQQVDLRVCFLLGEPLLVRKLEFLCEILDEFEVDVHTFVLSIVISTVLIDKEFKVSISMYMFCFYRFLELRFGNNGLILRFIF